MRQPKRSTIARCPKRCCSSAPSVTPPASLANKLFAATTATAEPAKRAAAAVQTQPGDAGPSLWDRFRATLPGSGLRPLPVLAAIALVTLLAVNVYLINQIGLLRGSFDDLEGRLGRQTAVLTQVGEGTNVRISLPPGPAGVATAAYGTLGLIRRSLWAFCWPRTCLRLPPTRHIRSGWDRADTMVSAGLFEADAAGYGKIVFSAPLPMGQYNSVRNLHPLSRPLAAPSRPPSRPSAAASTAPSTTARHPRRQTARHEIWTVAQPSGFQVVHPAVEPDGFLFQRILYDGVGLEVAQL